MSPYILIGRACSFIAARILNEQNNTSNFQEHDSSLALVGSISRFKIRL